MEVRSFFFFVCQLKVLFMFELPVYTLPIKVLILIWLFLIVFCTTISVKYLPESWNVLRFFFDGMVMNFETRIHSGFRLSMNGFEHEEKDQVRESNTFFCVGVLGLWTE